MSQLRIDSARKVYRGRPCVGPWRRLTPASGGHEVHPYMRLAVGQDPNGLVDDDRARHLVGEGVLAQLSGGRRQARRKR